MHLSCNNIEYKFYKIRRPGQQREFGKMIFFCRDLSRGNDEEVKINKWQRGQCSGGGGSPQ